VTLVLEGPWIQTLQFGREIGDALLEFQDFVLELRRRGSGAMLKPMLYGCPGNVRQRPGIGLVAEPPQLLILVFG
jgi:hypothetical protein